MAQATLLTAALCALSACTRPHCPDDCAADSRAGHQDAIQARARSANYQIALGTDLQPSTELRSEGYRMQLSIDPTRLAGQR